jgi:RNA polymerase sigma-70 factor, ECF subfamily
MELADQVAGAMGQLRSMTRRKGIPPQDVEDVVSETVMRALEMADRFTGGNLYSWLATILHYVIKERWRMVGANRRSVDIDEGESDPVIGLALSVAPAQGGALALADVLIAMDRLPPRDRDVLERVGVHGMSCGAYGAARGLACGTVRSRLSRARAALAVELERLPNRRLRTMTRATDDKRRGRKQSAPERRRTAPALSQCSPAPRRHPPTMPGGTGDHCSTPAGQNRIMGPGNRGRSDPQNRGTGGKAEHGGLGNTAAQRGGGPAPAPRAPQDKVVAANKDPGTCQGQATSLRAATPGGSGAPEDAVSEAVRGGAAKQTSATAVGTEPTEAGAERRSGPAVGTDHARRPATTAVGAGDSAAPRGPASPAADPRAPRAVIAAAMLGTPDARDQQPAIKGSAPTGKQSSPSRHPEGTSQDSIGRAHDGRDLPYPATVPAAIAANSGMELPASLRTAAADGRAPVDAGG